MSEAVDHGAGASYQYFILGNLTPVRLHVNHRNHVTGAQVPDVSVPGGFRWSCGPPVRSAIYLHT